MRSAHTILVVDDHAASLYAASRLLRLAGFNVLEASNGEDAMQLAERASALLLDVNLPDLNGVAVCHAVKARSAKPIVMMSAVYRDDVHREAAMQAGADVYLVQPIDGDQVAAEFDRLLA
jgi:DNA-binding response OmpR family regulator